MLGMVTADNLSDAERRIWEGFPSGKARGIRDRECREDDPADGEGWGPERQVRAEAITPLLCGVLEVEPGHVGEIHLQRVRITGKLEVPGGDFQAWLRLDQCYMADGIDLSEATTKTLDLRGCHVGGIFIDGATIKGDFLLSGAHLEGKGGRALVLEGSSSPEACSATTGSALQGRSTCSVPASEANSALGVRTWMARMGRALTADAITVGRGMFCGMGFSANGEVRLYRASINGIFQLGGATLDGRDGPALTASGLTVTGDMHCAEGFQASGGDQPRGGAVSGELLLRGANLDCKGGRRPGCWRAHRHRRHVLRRRVPRYGGDLPARRQRRRPTRL